MRDNELFQSHLDEAIGVINNGAWSNFLWDLISRDSGKFLGQTLLILRKQLDMGSITQLDLLNVAMTSRDENGSTLLHVAAAGEHSNALSFCQFFADEIDFNLKTANNSGRTVRDIACASANVELSKWAKLCWNLEDIINNGVWFSFTFTLIIGEDANLLTLFLNILHNALDKNRITESEILNVMLKSRGERKHSNPSCYHAGARTCPSLLRVLNIHADIKPRNVIRTSNGYIKLIDFSASVNIENQRCLRLTQNKAYPKKNMELLYHLSLRGIQGNKKSNNNASV